MLLDRRWTRAKICGADYKVQPPQTGNCSSRDFGKCGFCGSCGGDVDARLILQNLRIWGFPQLFVFSKTDRQEQADAQNAMRTVKPESGPLLSREPAMTTTTLGQGAGEHRRNRDDGEARRRNEHRLVRLDSLVGSTGAVQRRLGTPIWWFAERLWGSQRRVPDELSIVPGLNDERVCTVPLRRCCPVGRLQRCDGPGPKRGGAWLES